MHRRSNSCGHIVNLPGRVEGWLDIFEGVPGSCKKDKKPEWSQTYCVLEQNEKSFVAYNSEEISNTPLMAVGPLKHQRIRLDQLKFFGKLKWDTPPPLEEEIEDSDSCSTEFILNTTLQSTLGEIKSKTLPRKIDDIICKLSDTSYEKACRRGSVPATPVLSPKQNPNDNSNTSRFAHFFSKRSNPLKRTKSVTKLERTKRGSGGLRGSRSHESLLSNHGIFSTIDLSCVGNVDVVPVHQSVLGRQYCFKVRSSQDRDSYYSCSSRQERDLWIYSLRKAMIPNKEYTRHIENSLKMWIYEAKNLPPKKKYFCEINLDNILYGRTSVKLQTDILFWGEHFDFPDIPDIDVITVNIFREAEKKRKRDKNVLVGSVVIPIHEVASNSLSETWYQIINEKSDTLSRNNKEIIPTMRIKCRFQSIDILPLSIYSNFMAYLKNNYCKLCECLEPVISVKAKEDIGQSLVLFMYAQGQASSFLADVVALDLQRIGDQRLTFRGNSLATKSMEAFLKLTGEQYLQNTLSVPINEIIHSDNDCEVDPTKSSGPLQKQQISLRTAVSSAWQCIYESHKNFPTQLQLCFAIFRQRLETLGRTDMADNLISASIFLRFLCPAILSPSLFYITNELPSARSTRNLTLVAKTLQTLANFTKFQGKEYFMEFLNDFLDEEAPHMKQFLQLISTHPGENDQESILDWTGYIDQGKHLAILHSLLCESVTKLGEDQLHDLDPLVHILDEITNAKQNSIYNTSTSFEHKEMPMKTENSQSVLDPTASFGSNKDNSTLSQQAVKTKVITSERGIIRGVLTPNSLEANVLPCNTSEAYKQWNQIVNRDSNIMSDSKISNSQAGNRTSTYHEPLHYVKSQSSICSSSVNDSCNNMNLFNSSSSNMPNVPNKKSERCFYSRLSADSLCGTKVLCQEDERETYFREVKQFGSNMINPGEIGDLIQISGLDSNSAFVRKSPTPMMKLTAGNSNHTQGILHNQNRKNEAVKLYLGIPDHSQANNIQVPGVGKQEPNSNNNIPINLEDLDDLFKYAEEHAVVEEGFRGVSQTSQSLIKNAPSTNPVSHTEGHCKTNSSTPLAFKNPSYQMHVPSGPLKKKSISPIINHYNSIQIKNNGSYYDTANILKSNAGQYPKSFEPSNTKIPISSSSSEERLSSDKLKSLHCELNRPFVKTNNCLSNENMGLDCTSALDKLKKSIQCEGVYEQDGGKERTFDANQQQNRGIARTKSKTHTNGGISSRSDSSDTDGNVKEFARQQSDRINRETGKSRSKIYDQSGEIRFLQETLDTLKSTLDRDEIELQGTIEELPKLNFDESESMDKAGISNNPSLQSESTMRSIIDRLITMEEELRREQLKMSLALSQKQRVIEEQGQQIEALANSNNRLLCALTALRQRYETQQQKHPLPQ